MEINEAIRKIRKGKNYTQEQIATVLMTTQQQYSKYENDKQEIPARHIKKLCEFYDAPANMLLGIETYYAPGEAKTKYERLYEDVEDMIYWANYQGHISDDAEDILLSNLHRLKETMDNE